LDNNIIKRLREVILEARAASTGVTTTRDSWWRMSWKTAYRNLRMVRRN